MTSFHMQAMPSRLDDSEDYVPLRVAPAAPVDVELSYDDQWWETAGWNPWRKREAI